VLPPTALQHRQTGLFNMKKKQATNLSPKFTFGFLIIVGVATLLLGFVSLAQNIRLPLTAREKSLEQAQISTASNDFGALLNTSAQESARLQNQDTDADGISDYDELNIYGTSPYLADSDSDGFLDKQEIETNHDPNCPGADDCRQIELANEAQDINAGFFEELVPATEAPEQAAGLDLSSLSATQLRQLLLESGEITAEQLQQIDNDTLLEAYQGIIGEQE
jgi:hypothetical protein